MDEPQRIEQAIAAQESLRTTVGDEVVDETISLLRRELAHLETPSENIAQQRKLVTILYADIVGSTNIVKHLDPEDALEIMDGSLKQLAAPVEQHGGHVSRFMGDGFKAVIGMPKAQENDPEMAIRAGLSILEVSQELGAELETQWGISDFQVRVGINTGLVALGGMTEAEDTVMGSTVNLAKRVESSAPPGGLLISHNTYRHVRGVFNVQMHESIEAKGFDGQIQVYLVEEVKPRAFRVQTRGVEGIETRMVGREVELLALQQAYRNAIEGAQTQVVSVVGEAGVGKSRLLYEFQNWLELLPDVTFLFQGRGRLETQNLPYAMLRDVFTFRFKIQESDKTKEVQEKIEQGFGEVLGGAEEGQMRAHIIGQLLGFDFSTSQHLKSILDDPQQIHDRALMYLAEYFQGISKQVPVVVLLEDIHWADDSSLDMLNRLARRIQEQRLLIVCVARHRLYERRPHWGEGLAYHRRLELQPLTKHDSSQLVTEILQKVDQIPESLQDLVVKGAEGNPFYIEELVKMLIDDGVVITGEVQWQIEPERLAGVDVPDTLTGVLQARLEGLPQEERSTLQQASVVGHIFWDDTVEYITNDSSSAADTESTLRTTDENLSSLRSRELIYHREESAFTDVSEYTFKHAILRDVTYESVLKRVRKAYHGLVAEWLIQRSGERAGEYTGLIADHLELAGKTEQAAIYLYQAGESASKRYANDEAVGYFTRALALTPEDDLMGRYDLLLAHEKVLAIKGDREAQKNDLDALKEISESLDDLRKQAQVALCHIIYYLDVGDFPTIEEKVDGALQLAKAAGGVEWEAGILLSWGTSLWRHGKPKSALQPLEHALSLARDAKHMQLEADCLRNLGTAHHCLLDGDLAIALWKQALDKYRQLGDRRGEGLALNNLGVHYTELEINLLRAVDYYEQTLLINQEIGNRFGEGIASHNLGCTAWDQVDYAAAVTWLSQALEIQCEIGDRHFESSFRLDLGSCYFDLGEYEQARSYYTQTLKIKREIGDLEGEIIGLLAWLNFYRALGDYRSAQTYYKQLKAKWGEVEAPEIKAEILFNFSLLKLHLGDNQAAQEYCNQGLRILGDYEKHQLRWYGLTYLGHALTALDELEKAEEVYRKAISLGYETQKIRQAIEAQAGLARVSMARGDIEQALTQVEEILMYLENEIPSMGHPLDGTKEPFRIYLTCYQVLKVNDDLRAPTILVDAYNLLQTRATNISDEHLRNCFLNNVTVNREIVEAYKSRKQAQDTMP